MYDDNTRTQPVAVVGGKSDACSKPGCLGDLDAFGLPRSNFGTVGHPFGVRESGPVSESERDAYLDYDGHPFAPAGHAGINGSRPCAVRGCVRWPSAHVAAVLDSHGSRGSLPALGRFWPFFWASLAASCVSVLFWSVVFPWLAVAFS